VQASTARPRQRRQTGCPATPASAAAALGQAARIAQTPQFGRGVNPSPVPDPQSFQNVGPGPRRKAIRASAICPMIHSRGPRPWNRNRLRVATVWSGILGPV
jgi:hypothetical protein